MSPLTHFYRYHQYPLKRNIDVETPRRLSLTFNSARCRSLSESWALSSPVSTNSTGFTALLLSSTSSSSLMTPPPSLPSSPLSSLYQTTPLSPMSNDDASTKGGISQEQEKEQEQVQDQDQDLLKSLASFLQKQNQTQVELPGAPSTTLASASAGPVCLLFGFFVFVWFVLTTLPTPCL